MFRRLNNGWISRAPRYARVPTNYKPYPFAQYASLSARDSDNVDVCIVGAGPAGLAAAIRLKQLDKHKGTGDLRVVVLDKASDVGSHIVSGAILEPRALDELIPDWKVNPPSPCDIVQKETLRYLTKSYSIPLFEPAQLRNTDKNYVVSLNNVTKWLGEHAESLGVELYPGFSVSELVYHDENHKSKYGIKGVATNDMGVSKNLDKKDNYEAGMEFHAKCTLLAEGCHGSLSKEAISVFDLRRNSDPQTYGLGIKEVWQVDPSVFKRGFVSHTVGYPLSIDCYGGGFMYHFGENLVAVGLVIGLDYANPYISPYQEFQRMKHHPFYSSVLKSGKCLSYAARALNEGGFQSIPELVFPGGALIGCSAGFVNVPKIKGSHTAMKSGMLAAESLFEKLQEPLADQALTISSYPENLKKSWVWDELHEIRNVRPSFKSSLGLFGGIMYTGLETLIFRGRTPWTFHHKSTDAAATKPAAQFKPIKYPKPDGKISFDLMTSVSRTGTFHDDNEPTHLKVPEQDLARYGADSYPTFGGIESRFCPAGVYEYLDEAKSGQGIPRFHINAQNCIHCKTCDIKSPIQKITWTVPEGGTGPKYFMT